MQPKKSKSCKREKICERKTSCDNNDVCGPDDTPEDDGMSDVEKILKLFDGEKDRNQTFVTNFITPTMGAMLGFGSVMFANWTTRRPLLAGIQRHFLTAGVFFFVSMKLDEYRNNQLAERDAVLKHYIQLHPEDFPLPERKKFRQVLQPWVPVR